MRAATGVGAEVLGLFAILALGGVIPSGLPLAIYIVLAEVSASYLIHCPAHYVIGVAVGVRFRSLRLGHSSMAGALPPSLAGLVRIVPVPSLVIDRSSIGQVPNGRVAVMYASGAVASTGSALAIALAATWLEPFLYAAPALVIAVVYILSDIVLSPKSGDMARALRVWKAGKARLAPRQS